MRAILLPIKDVARAKQRLAGLLSPAECSALAAAMAEDVFAAVRALRSPIRVFVVTSLDSAIRVAEVSGWSVIRETQQHSESESVDFASRLCEDQGVTSLLRLPLDLPLLQPADIDELLSVELPSPGALLVSSRDSTGTNALARNPPTLFASQFGEGSFAKHIAAAQRTGARIIFRRNPRIEMDVDDPADLQELLRHDLSATATGRWLAASGIPERLLRGKVSPA